MLLTFGMAAIAAHRAETVSAETQLAFNRARLMAPPGWHVDNIRFGNDITVMGQGFNTALCAGRGMNLGAVPCRAGFRVFLTVVNLTGAAADFSAAMAVWTARSSKGPTWRITAGPNGVRIAPPRRKRARR